MKDRRGPACVRGADRMRLFKTLIMIITMVSVSAPVRSQDADAALALLGMDPPELCSRLGLPDEVYPFRGESEAQDDVVFGYSDGLSLFFFRNRVWQVRIEPAYVLDGALPFFSSREQVVEVLGEPFAADGDSFIYLLPDRAYPVRMRIFFSEQGMDDIYIYRADY